jgi:hypothetical protein
MSYDLTLTLASRETHTHSTAQQRSLSSHSLYHRQCSASRLVLSCLVYLVRLGYGFKVWGLGLTRFLSDFTAEQPDRWADFAWDRMTWDGMECDRMELDILITAVE